MLPFGLAVKGRVLVLPRARGIARPVRLSVSEWGAAAVAASTSRIAWIAVTGIANQQRTGRCGSCAKHDWGAPATYEEAEFPLGNRLAAGVRDEGVHLFCAVPCL